MPSREGKSRAAMAAKRDTDTFQRILPPVVPDWDDAEIDEGTSTFLLADQQGPEPVPAWVITEDAARQIDLGVLKCGKEADVHLVERRLGSAVNVLAAKQYRGFEDRLFRNDARYRTARRTGKSRIDRAMAKGSTAGMAFRARQWVTTEFEVLGRLWAAGMAVPYPVQLMGNEIMLELIGSPDRVAPRLAQADVSTAQARQLWEQIVDNLRLMVRTGVVHGDLSAYNVLLDGERAVFIDFPQAVDPIAHPEGMSLLERDVLNLTIWFHKRGIRSDASELVAELIGEALRCP